jgi:2-polyprenyl-6-methoxyphenol hydroxylase-like FAD-dependent oxidoreductase
LIGSHAVVIGAGIGGLCAAEVLSEFYETVTVVERDNLPEGPTARAGVAQGRHVHVVLARAARALDQIYPGLIRSFMEQGVPHGDVQIVGRAYLEGHRLARGRSGLQGFNLRRPHLEHEMRMRLITRSSVRINTSTTVTGIIPSAEGLTVAGVQLRDRDELTQNLDADLVVDASGRGSQLPKWLSDIGYPSPPEQRLRIDVAYTSLEFSVPAAQTAGVTGIGISATRANPRGGAMIKLGDDLWLVSLVGYAGFHPPIDVDGFLDHAARLVVPDIHCLLQGASPVGRPVRHRIPDAVRRRYDQLPRFPAGLVVLGDAIASFNPICGQGMAVAAQQALTLRASHRQESKKLRRSTGAAVKASQAAWIMSTASDRRMPWIEGARALPIKLANAYSRRLYSAAAHDPVVATAILRAINLVAPPSTVVRPDIALRVLLQSLRRGSKHATEKRQAGAT